MTCGSCVARVKNELLKLGDILSAEIKLDSPQASITMAKHIPTLELQKAVSKAGNYQITETMAVTAQMNSDAETEPGTKANYFPVYLIFFFLLIISAGIPLIRGNFDWGYAMMQFMGGFFLFFSFFKFLDLRGFAEAYSSYDIIAGRWKGWGYLYAFIEFALGIAFLSGFNPLLTNSVTMVVMSVSIVGVLQSVLNRRKIRCACLGTVFNLPMSTLTIIEDGLMIGMSLFMVLRIMNFI